MSEIPDVVTGATITSEWGNDIRDRVTQRYASAAARSGSVPSPAEGDMSYLLDTNHVYRYDGAAWVQLTPDTITAYEIDGYTEVASVTPIATFAAAASVSLTIPASWASWKCSASASWSINTVTGSSSYSARLMIDGTALQTLAGITITGAVFAGALVGRRSGMTTTGVRTVALQVAEPLANSVMSDIALYARAVRLT